MVKKVKDGWHTAYGYEVWVEKGKAIRGVQGSGVSRKTVYFYKNYGMGSAVKVTPTLETLRRGLKNGTYFVM